MWITIMGLALSMLTNVQYRMAPYSPYGGARRGIHHILGLQRTVTVHYISSRTRSQLSVVALEMRITKSVVQTRRCWNVQKRRLQIIKQTAFSLWVRPFFYALIFNLCFQVC